MLLKLHTSSPGMAVASADLVDDLPSNQFPLLSDSISCLSWVADAWQAHCQLITACQASLSSFLQSTPYCINASDPVPSRANKSDDSPYAVPDSTKGPLRHSSDRPLLPRGNWLPWRGPQPRMGERRLNDGVIPIRSVSRYLPRPSQSRRVPGQRTAHKH